MDWIDRKFERVGASIFEEEGRQPRRQSIWANGKCSPCPSVSTRFVENNLVVPIYRTVAFTIGFQKSDAFHLYPSTIAPCESNRPLAFRNGDVCRDRHGKVFNRSIVCLFEIRRRHLAKLTAEPTKIDERNNRLDIGPNQVFSVGKVSSQDVYRLDCGCQFTVRSALNVNHTRGKARDVDNDSRDTHPQRPGGSGPRRLVERGVSFVTVNNRGWDTHNDLYTRLKEGYTGARTPIGLVPSLDLALSALVEDLKERGLLDETLIVAMGEFGRTPKLNTTGGRDHGPLRDRLCELAAEVEKCVEGFLARLSPEALSRPVDMTPWGLGMWTGLNIYILHGYDHPKLHGGAIARLKGLQGAAGWATGWRPPDIGQPDH